MSEQRKKAAAEHADKSGERLTSGSEVEFIPLPDEDEDDKGQSWFILAFL
ncbi:hypothetical protein M3201_24605 [Paenibacillus motobuensis]|nr:MULTISPECIES: hypothetical protein [Paenibacillus]MCM3042844.1 hypothetical protein [Paenibacillus lutimineralis]MCM3649948.1 hypothetical protein [Paenibacillus motobuensis]